MTPISEPITGQTDGATRSPALSALADFYRGFNTRDMATVADNWATTDDIAMDNPLGGIRRGWPAIRDVYEQLFSGPARVYVEFYDYTLHEHGNIFYVVGRERGEFTRGALRVPLAIRTSRIYRRIDGQWRQVHHHGSIDDPALLDRYQRAVRGERPSQDAEKDLRGLPNQP